MPWQGVRVQPSSSGTRPPCGHRPTASVYVARKLAQYKSARLPNLILCIDESRNCSEADLPPEARVIRFRRGVDAAAVLRIVG